MVTEKPFNENADGTKDFDPEKIINPLNGKLITSWYKPGQTPDSVLGEVSSSIAECRAETVALHLGSNLNILKIFDTIENIQYISSPLMARAGIRALEFYDFATKKHGQAHMQALFGITLNLIKSGLRGSRRSAPQTAHSRMSTSGSTGRRCSSKARTLPGSSSSSCRCTRARPTGMAPCVLHGAHDVSPRLRRRAPVPGPLTQYGV
ncbi:peptidase family M49-domain-containing protein [Trametes punicea]|nr:peptidase family M49-domain-containing protein [Trametes punicea]